MTRQITIMPPLTEAIVDDAHRMLADRLIGRCVCDARGAALCGVCGLSGDAWERAATALRRCAVAAGCRREDVEGSCRVFADAVAGPTL